MVSGLQVSQNDRFTSHRAGRSYSINNELFCNVVYLLSCKSVFHTQYVGSTTTKFMLTFYNHIKSHLRAQSLNEDFNDKGKEDLIYRHFYSP